jgi:hypothetical protein
MSQTEEVQSSDSEQQDFFEFKDIIPFLEDKDNDGDVTLSHPAAGEEREREIRPPVPAPRRATQIDSPPVWGFETLPHQWRGHLSTPIQRLPQGLEGDKKEGAAGGEERSATFKEQTAYYLALLNKIETYTDEA